MKSYKQYEISATPFAVDMISSLLWELDINGITEEDEKIFVYVGEEKTADLDSITTQLNKLKSEGVINDFNINEDHHEEINWNEEWENNREIVRVGERLVIKPSFRNYENKPDDIIIEIDPKMSFGTGEHQTTKLILVLLEKYIAPGIKVLDVGSGTGILAIASVKLGASYALGVDNDEWCRINGEENIERNGMQSKVYIKEGEIDSVIDSDFDLVLANINKNVLLEIKETLYSKCKPGGLIIISGILESDKTNLETEYTNLGLKVLENQQLDEWSAIVFQN